MTLDDITVGRWYTFWLGPGFRRNGVVLGKEPDGWLTVRYEGFGGTDTIHFRDICGAP